MLKKFFTKAILRMRLGLFLLTYCLYFAMGPAIAENSQSQAKSHTIVILLHLYNIALMDEFIVKINNFMLLNKSHTFYIKINVPVDDNVNNFSVFNEKIVQLKHDESTFKECKDAALYHPDKVTYDNYLKLHCITTYLKEKLDLDKRKIQVLFSENRGADIGGFFLLLDQVIKENLSHDYLVKLHTKTHKKWRNKLLAILDLELNEYIPKFESVYACNRICNDQNKIEKISRLKLEKILNFFQLSQKKEFFFPAGTMFIVSHKMTDFFKKYNRITLFNQLNIGYEGGIKIEHAYERFFGYLMEKLHLPTYYLSRY